MDSEDKIRKADDVFYETFRGFQLFQFLNPTNRQEERDRFFDSFERGKAYHPRFDYDLLPSNLGQSKKKLLTLDLGGAGFEKIYQRTRDELCRLFELAEAHGSLNVTEKALALFGEPKPELVAEATKACAAKQALEPRAPQIGLKILVEKIRDRLRNDRIEGWDIVEDPSCVTLAQVDWAHHKIRLQSGLIIGRDMVERLLGHLIQVHIYRSVNGERQPYKAFAVGLAQHMETEEGLAVLVEERSGLLTPRVRHRYSGRVVAAHLAIGTSFFDIFSRLVEFFSPEEAYTLTERSKRGLKDTSKAGGFIFDHIFLQGKQKVENLSRMEQNNLFTGKISISDLPVITQMLEENRILEPAFLPDSFHG